VHVCCIEFYPNLTGNPKKKSDKLYLGFDVNNAFSWASVKEKYRVSVNYRRILQNNIFTNTEQKYMMLIPFKRGMLAVS
jgi:hypothetical protein